MQKITKISILFLLALAIAGPALANIHEDYTAKTHTHDKNSKLKEISLDDQINNADGGRY
jgi:hypothetical protein